MYSNLLNNEIADFGFFIFVDLGHDLFQILNVGHQIKKVSEYYIL